MPVYRLCTYRGNLARCSPHSLSPACQQVRPYVHALSPCMYYNLPELSRTLEIILNFYQIQILQTLYEVNTQITQVGHRVDTHMAHAQTHTLDISD